MPIVVNQISASLEAREEEIIRLAEKAVGIRSSEVLSAAVAKTSVDARRRPIRLVHSVELTLSDAGLEKKLSEGNASIRLREHTELPELHGTESLSARPVVVGFGPAGMFAGLRLAREGFRPLILERGAPVEERVRDVENFWKTGKLLPDSSVQFGEGGAGTFSDGKLVTRIGDPYCEWVLRTFVEFGAPRELLVRQKPHIGTDRLREVVASIRMEIERLGGEVRFHARVDGFSLSGGKIAGVRVNGLEIPAGAVILAVGHSARDTFRVLHGLDIPMEPKPFSVGVRVEHLQSSVDKALYGEYAGHPALPQGEYQLSLRRPEGAVYTFCMCPGGVVVPAASEEGGVVTNGMSEYARDGRNANAAMAVSVDGSEFGSGLFDGMEYQRSLEQAAYLQGGKSYRAPMQSVGRFLAGKNGYELGRVNPTFAAGVEPGDFHSLFSSRVNGLLRLGLLNFDRKMSGFAAEDTLLTGVETRTSSPLRILRGEDLTAVGNLYPCGEGAGYAGGITSAAVDGLRCADAILSRYAAF